jgi:hypothetical protein
VPVDHGGPTPDDSERRSWTPTGFKPNDKTAEYRSYRTLAEMEMVSWVHAKAVPGTARLSTSAQDDPRNIYVFLTCDKYLS